MKAHILVVDDERDFLTLVQGSLGSDRYEVWTAKNGEEYGTRSPLASFARAGTIRANPLHDREDG